MIVLGIIFLVCIGVLAIVIPIMDAKREYNLQCENWEKNREKED